MNAFPEPSVATGGASFEAIYGKRPFPGDTLGDVVKAIETGRVVVPQGTRAAREAIIVRAVAASAAIHLVAVLVPSLRPVFRTYAMSGSEWALP